MLCAKELILAVSPRSHNAEVVVEKRTRHPSFLIVS